MEYRREIDGLRAFAVLAVIFYHAGFAGFPGGYVGVDVFFVISGYLITGIIAKDLAAGSFSLLHFYERRARRILPALSLVLAVSIPFAWAWMMPWQFKDFSQGLVAVSLFASNFLFWTTSGYFEVDAEINPLLHTWSLAVEEQYYFVFPLLVLVLWRLGKPGVFAALGLIWVASLALAQWGWSNDPAGNFYLLPSRAWELLTGALCALVMRDTRLPRNDIAAGVGLFMIAISVAAFGPLTPFPSLYTLLPVAGTALILLFATGRSVIARFLSLKLFVAIGLVSYSAYLWHQPIFAFTRMRSMHELGALHFGALILLTFLLAYLSWRFVEQPFRRRPLPVLPKKTALFGAAAFVSIAFIAAGLTGHLRDGANRNIAFFADGYWDNKWECVFTGRLPDTNALDNCQGEAGTVLLVGDSHADVLSRTIREALAEQNMGLVTIAARGCLPVDGTIAVDAVLSPSCPALTASLESIVETIQPKTVMLSARWTMYLEGTRFTNETGIEELGADPTYIPTSAVEVPRKAEVARLTGQMITSLADLVPVIVIDQIPETGAEVPKLAAFGDKDAPVIGSRERYDARNALTNQVLLRAASHKDVQIVHTANAFCDDRKCVFAEDGVLYYFDHNHLTGAGAQRLVPFIRQAISALPD